MPPAGGPRPATAPVSVVVITRNRRPELLANLPRLLELDERPPVIVVDNGSEDGSADAVTRAFPGVQVAAVGRNMGGAGRNLGVALADTPYVAFADDDSWWEPGALGQAVRLLDAHPRLALVAARVVVGPDQRVDPACQQMAASPLPPAADLPGPPVLGFIACGAVVRAAAFLGVGGFDERMEVGGEEQLVAGDLAAAGWGLCYAEDVVARHAPSPVRDGEVRRRRVVRNDLWHAWLRRRWTVALGRTLSAAVDATRDESVRAGLIEATGRVPEVLRRRRPLPAAIDRQFDLLD